MGLSRITYDLDNIVVVFIAGKMQTNKQKSCMASDNNGKSSAMQINTQIPEQTVMLTNNRPDLLCS